MRLLANVTSLTPQFTRRTSAAMYMLCHVAFGSVCQKSMYMSCKGLVYMPCAHVLAVRTIRLHILEVGKILLHIRVLEVRKIRLHILEVRKILLHIHVLEVGKILLHILFEK